MSTQTYGSAPSRNASVNAERVPTKRGLIGRYLKAKPRPGRRKRKDKK